MTGINIPQRNELLSFVFSGLDEELFNYVTELYNQTFDLLEKLYDDCKNTSLIRDEITIDNFKRLCDMYSRINPNFYKTEEEMDLVIKSIIRSFK